MNCPNCRATLPWNPQQPASYPQSQDGYQYGEEADRPTKRAPWIIAIACLALIAVATLAVVYLPGMFKQSGQQPPASQSQFSQPNLHTAPTDNDF